MKLMQKLCYVVFLLLLFIWWGGAAQAIPIPSAEISYSEKQNIDDRWQYDFTFINTTEPAVESLWYLYQVDLELSEAVTVDILSPLPDNWAVVYPNSNSTYVRFIATAAVGSGIAPDSSLAGFSFLFNLPVSTIKFVALFEDAKADNTDFFGGTATQIPEPATILLVATGSIGLGLFRRKKFKNKL